MVLRWGRFGTGCATGDVRRSVDPQYNGHAVPGVHCVWYFCFEMRRAVEAAQGGRCARGEGSGM